MSFSPVADSAYFAAAMFPSEAQPLAGTLPYLSDAELRTLAAHWREIGHARPSGYAVLGLAFTQREIDNRLILDACDETLTD